VFLTVVGIALSLAIFAIYWQTRKFAFVTYDDSDYVYANPWVLRGLTFRGFMWATTALNAINWHPLTWLSHMLDVQLFGLEPGPHHLVSVGFHLASTLLLLAGLTRLTGQPGRSALVAAIFAVHPLHVESVAWVAERKDVLSTFFEVLTIVLYTGYARKRTTLRYSAVLLTFVCALMAKPMAVTCPIILLLLDFWPLGRLKLPLVRREVWGLIEEKIPLLALALVDGVLTSIAQARGHAMMSLHKISVFGRLGHAAIAYIWYVRKAFWPVRLSFFYPLEQEPLWQGALALLALAAVTAAALHWRTRRPWFLVGWLWYLVMLLPVIGIVQVGIQGVADRYSYFPLTGLSIAVVWLLADALSERVVLQRIAGAAATAGLVILAVLAHRETASWKDSETLYRHGIAAVDKNFVAENNLGAFLSLKGRHAEATELYRKPVEAHWDMETAYANLAGELLLVGQFDEAFGYLQEALRLNPNTISALAELGELYMRRGDFRKARELLAREVKLAPNDFMARTNLCIALARSGSVEEGIGHCRIAISQTPRSGNARVVLANILIDEGRKAEAIKVYEEVLEVAPEYPGVRQALDVLRRDVGSTGR
jgi:tetratricopeptide (TPR) repeat protein